MSVAILVPVLARPHRVEPLLASIAAATPEPYRVLFVCDPDDRGERAAVDAAGGEQITVDGGYALKINRAVRGTDDPLVFLAADDLDFQPGWFEAAQAQIAAGAAVVGVNDLIPRRPGREGHATHFLMTREYAELPTLDGERGPLCERYHHSFCDDELIATATHRGAYAYADGSHVRHLHPMAGGADDETYRKGRARFRLDRKLFGRRSALWT